MRVLYSNRTSLKLQPPWKLGPQRGWFGGQRDLWWSVHHGYVAKEREGETAA